MAASIVCSDDLLGMSGGGGPPPATTTISTIAVQSGNTRIVIALLQSKEWIQLKIQEMHPAMTDIGSNLREVTELYQQHEKVLEKLQTKQSPVEELLRQADDLISTQKPRGEVYSAMAENLGLAWKDLNAQLEQRRQILEQAVAFFAKAEQFSDSMDAIQRSVSETFLPNTVESTVSILNRIKEERKVGLSNSMRMLGEGQLLLERLCEVSTHSMGDSRPDHMRPAARQTSAFVERHMEALQDRWRNLEASWTVKRGQLEQCLARCRMERELAEVEHWLRTKGSEYVSEHNLGDSSASSEILLHEHHKIENECKERQEHCLRLVKCAEDLQKQGNYAGEELRSRSYLLLSECADIMSTLDQRRQLLVDTVNFFNKAQTAQTKLDQIEIQLSASESSTSLWATADEVANSAIQDGRRILANTGMTEPGSQGVARKVEELEWKKKKICDLCKAKESKVSEKTVAFKKFCEKYDELIKWLTNSGQFFVQRTRDMGTTQTAAKAFLDQHETLQNDLRMKFMEAEALLRTVPNLVRSGGEEAEVVHSKSENLKQQFSQLRTTFEKRILIAQRYLAFLKLSTKVSKEMDELESLVKQAVDSPDQSKFRSIEEKQFTLRQEFLQMNNNGKNFLEDARKVEDMYLNMTQPCATVEELLNRLELRNVSLNTQWLNLQNEISATRETLIHWDHLVKDSNRVLNCCRELERKLFPVIPQELYRSDTILTFLEKRMSDVLPQIKSVQKEIEVLLKKSETSKPKEGSQAEGSILLQNLQEANHTLQRRLTDYQILVSMMITFFKNHEELEKLVDMQESQFRMTSLPSDVTRLEVLMHDHESSRPTVMELFKFSYTELQQLMKKINESEPPEAAARDIEKLSTIHSSRKLTFEKSWEEYKYKLEQHNQLCTFFRDMHLINQQIEDLNNQMSSIRQAYGESLPSAVHTSEAFHQFEKTIEILQIRIQEFVSTAERLMRDQRVDTGQVHGEIETLQRKWSTFRTEVTTNRRLIDVAIEYYKTVEEAEEWLQEGSRLLISVARKSSTCTKESDAEGLQKEIREFLARGKPKQEERLKKISTLSQQLYGNQAHPSSSIVTNKNKDMFDSFTVISTELNTMTTNIKIAQQAKIVEQKGKEEMDAALHAAQAEAETARAAAAAALQAARVAEAAALKPQQRPPRFIKALGDTEVPEGTRQTFECEVDGEPTPQVQWFKDGILVENNPDYQTSFDRGVCKLTIEETFSEDTAKFTCRATNSAGIAETHSQLIVKESRVPSELIPPHFVQEPVDSTVSEFESHSLECQVFGNPLPLVSWFKDDTCIDYSTDYAISCNNGHCSLRIEEANLEHQGRYTCRAVNPVGQVACSANITVQTKAPSERPTFVSPLSNVMARAGQKLRLECSIAGQPQPQVSWLHNSKSLKETRDTKLHFDGCNATLVITEAFPKDAGTYTIIARNKAGEAVSSCNVSVKGRLPMETSDSEIASDIEPAKPQVKQHLEDQTVSEGNKVRMDCIIVGQPEPEVIWYHNGKPVKESDDFQLLFEGDRCTLVIEVAYLEDAGTYRCVAINSGGEASSSCNLKVEPALEIIQKSQTSFSQKDILVSIEKFEPPKFLKLLDNVIVTEGQEIFLECQVTGEPGTALNWFKDGQQLTSTPECQITSDPTGVFRLRIPAARPSDRGTYSARAHSRGGEAQSICSVFVSVPLTFDQTIIPQAPPTFLKHVANQNLGVGGTARFETLVEGTPNPQVRWNFQGKPVPRDQHHELGSDGDKTHWLTVKNIGREHAGRYSAIAENDAGIATTSALLSIDGPLEKAPVCEEYQAQSMIMTRKAVMQTSTISSMSEVSDADYQPPEFPSFSSLQSQQLVKREQSTFTRVEQATTPAPHIQAPVKQAPAIQTPSFQTPAFPAPVKQAVQAPSFQAPYMPAPVKPEPAFQAPSIPAPAFQAPAPVPVVQPTVVRSAISQLPQQVPPKFIRPVSTASLTEGEKLFLEAQYEGVPEPTIQWFKDDVELKNKPGIQITAGGRRTSLFAAKSAESDSGRYSCIASNNAGKATSIADVRVKPYREAPRFKKKLQASVVKSGSRLELEVEVTGVPVPDVKWYRNENQLKDSPDFRISASASNHTLVISEVFPEDSGTYMVVASNLAGETKCLADLIVEEDKSPEEEKRIFYQEFSSVQQTKQMFTKLSTNAPQPALEPLKCVTEIKSLEAPPPPKIPSPPPMAAVSVKVWNQPKPQPFTPAITETQEPIQIPSPEPILEPEEFTPICQEISTRTSDFPTQPETSQPTSFVSGMSESFVKQSIMKFSHPEAEQQAKSEDTKTSMSFSPAPIVQNGVHSDLYSSSSTVSQNTVIFDSKSISTTGSGYPSPSKVPQVPKLSFVPKTFTSGSFAEPEKKPTTIWPPKLTPALKSTPHTTAPEEATSAPLNFPHSTTVTETYHSSTGSRSQIPTETFSSGGEKTTIFSSRSGGGTTSDKTSDSSKSTSTTSCQTSTGPSSSVYSTESSTTTRTSYSTEEISITKKYEMVLEHSSEVISSGNDISTVTPKTIIKTTLDPKPIIKKESDPKPIIKKDVDHKARPKKEVVIEEVPVVGAEVKPPHFAKVRGTESLRKIFTDI